MEPSLATSQNGQPVASGSRHSPDVTLQNLGSQNSEVFSTITVVSTNSSPNEKMPSKLSKWMRDWITDWWGAELACWVIASASILSIFIVLESHKGKPLPEWPFGITINALISILATTGQMAMMKPVIECLSQLKFLWFIRRQKLMDFQAFDDASRGPTGSLMLLGKVHNVLVSIGALIAVLSIAFGTFAQQVVTYPSHSHPSGNSSIPLVLNLTGFANGFGNSPEIWAALYSGQSNHTSTNLSNIAASCSTGNCTWDIYPSLGVCASVIDLSQIISNNACNMTAFEEVFEAVGIENPGYPCFNYTIPSNVLKYVYSSVGLSESLIGNASLSNAVPLDPAGFPLGMNVFSLVSGSGALDSTFLTTYLLYQPDIESSINSSLARPVAYELSLGLCVQKYDTVVIDGITTTSIVSSQPLELDHLDYLLTNETIIPGDMKTMTVDGFDFGAVQYAVDNMAVPAMGYFTDSCYQISFNASNENLIQVNENNEYCLLGLGQEFLAALQTSDPLSSIEGLMQSFATSLTNTFRSGAGGSAEIFEFQGIAYAPKTYVGSNYLWLIFPLALVSLTLVFLIATITKSQRLGSRIWKSSNLATMQGLHLDLHAKLGGLTSISEMEEKAEMIKVRFDMESGKAQQGVEYRLLESKRAESWK